MEKLKFIGEYRQYKYYEIGDTIKQMVADRMQEIDPSTYTDEDLFIYFSNPHTNIVAMHEDTIVAFACLFHIDNGYQMCYTYVDKAHKRSYAKGIDLIFTRYTPLRLAEGAMKFKKVQRIVNG